MKARRFGLVCALALVAGCGQGSAPAVTEASANMPTPAIMPAVAPPATAAAQASDSTVDAASSARFDGYGDMRFGMGEVAFAAAWGGDLKGAPEPDSGCHYKTPKWVKQPADFAFMFEGDRFVRYDVGTTKETAPGGGKVGMGAAQIRTLYGNRVSEQPHKYVAGASTLRVTAPTGSGVLVFETDKHGKVVRWRAGVPPQIDYVEGCG